mmetsp:Transcript_23764/g.34657  ORF Transcript_23764/g.34657 Transcript_23764/m.34657 type:complete len:303 (+) Transcript_23764:136-1044(+)
MIVEGTQIQPFLKTASVHSLLAKVDDIIMEDLDELCGWIDAGLDGDVDSDDVTFMTESVLSSPLHSCPISSERKLTLETEHQKMVTNGPEIIISEAPRDQAALVSNVVLPPINNEYDVLDLDATPSSDSVLPKSDTVIGDIDIDDFSDALDGLEHISERFGKEDDYDENSLSQFLPSLDHCNSFGGVISKKPNDPFPIETCAIDNYETPETISRTNMKPTLIERVLKHSSQSVVSTDQVMTARVYKLAISMSKSQLSRMALAQMKLPEESKSQPKILTSSRKTWNSSGNSCMGYIMQGSLAP